MVSPFGCLMYGSELHKFGGEGCPQVLEALGPRRQPCTLYVAVLMSANSVTLRSVWICCFRSYSRSA